MATRPDPAGAGVTRVCPGVVRKRDVAGLVFCGDGLSDPGNYFVEFETVSRTWCEPIPEAPYAIAVITSATAPPGPSSSHGTSAGRRAAAQPAGLAATPATR